MRKLLASLLLGSSVAMFVPLSLVQKYCDGNQPSALRFATPMNTDAQIAAALLAQGKFCRALGN